jgi:uncharacterized protein YjiS (DUF1127 family)
MDTLAQPLLDTEDGFSHLVQVCERLHRFGMPLTPEALQPELPGELSLMQCRKMLESDRLAAALQARGIDFAPSDALTAKQLHALAIYMDTSVPMTHRERLRNAGTTQRQWDGWMRNTRFAAYLEELSEERLAASKPLTHLRLLEAVDRGERWAIELHYEITGRHVKNQSGQDPRELFMAMFQILDEAGVDPAVMASIGERFRQLAAPGSAPAHAATVMLAPSAPRQ